jgi:hypothetical protein
MAGYPGSLMAMACTMQVLDRDDAKENYAVDMRAA